MGLYEGYIGGYNGVILGLYWGYNGVILVSENSAPFLGLLAMGHFQSSGGI